MTTKALVRTPPENRSADTVGRKARTRTNEGFVDNRPEALAQRRTAEAIHTSPYMAAQRQRLQRLFGAALQREGADEDALLQGRPEPRQRQGASQAELRQSTSGTAQPKETPAPYINRADLPDCLPAAHEHIPGTASDDVELSRDSAPPTQLKSSANTQGSDIRVASRQAQHLPQGTWRLVSQMQGRKTSIAQGQPAIHRRQETSEMTQQAIFGAGPILQCKFEDGTYARTAARGYVKIVKKAGAGDYLLLTEVATQTHSVIRKGGLEYEHLIRSPAMSGYSTTGAEGTIYSIQTLGGLRRQLLTQETDLEDLPHLTWAMQETNEDVQKASQIVEYLASLKDDPVIELAKSKLQEAAYDVPLAKTRTQFLTGYMAAGEQILELATSQLRETADNVVLAKIRTDFLVTYIDQGKTIFDLAKDQLRQANDDVALATKRTEFLSTYIAQGQATFEIAERELTRASNDTAQAQETMNSFTGLFQWAEKEAKEEGEKYYEGQKNAAEQNEEESKKKAFEESGLSKTALKNTKKLKHNPKYKTYKTEVSSAEETRKKALETAESEKVNVEAREFEANVKFVGETTKGALKAGTLQWLLEAAGNDKQKVTALQQMMERQADPNNRNLAISALKSASSVVQVATTCESLLAKNVAEKSAIAAAHFCSECGSKDACVWVKNKAETESPKDLNDHIYYLKENAKNVGNALLVLRKCGLDSIIYELTVVLDQKDAQIDWLVTTYHGTHHLSSLIYSLTSRKEKIEVLQELVNFNTANQNYNLIDLVAMVSTHGAATMLKVLQDTVYVRGAEAHPKFIQNYIGWGGKPDSSIQFLYLIRLQSILESAPATAFTVYQADVNYAGSHKPPSRTGFVEYRFVNGNRAEIHTHWNQNDKKLVSMHIQDAGGANGVEINKWKWFKEVQEAVRNAHNAGGAFPATTIPPGGQLTL